jgi:hypothetical protein
VPAAPETSASALSRYQASRRAAQAAVADDTADDTADDDSAGADSDDSTEAR